MTAWSCRYRCASVCELHDGELNAGKQYQSGRGQHSTVRPAMHYANAVIPCKRVQVLVRTRAVEREQAERAERARLHNSNYWIEKFMAAAPQAADPELAGAREASASPLQAVQVARWRKTLSEVQVRWARQAVRECSFYSFCAVECCSAKVAVDCMLSWACASCSCLVRCTSSNLAFKAAAAHTAGNARFESQLACVHCKTKRCLRHVARRS